MFGRRAPGTPPCSGAFNPALPQPLQGTKEAFRPDFDITHPKDWPTWLQNCHTEGGAVEVLADGMVIWWGGTMHDGIWTGPGIWVSGVWRDGIWMDGTWLDGKWCYGEWRGGTFLCGTWRDGIFRAGRFEGLWLGGLWLGGEFSGFRQRSIIPPLAPAADLDMYINQHRILLGLPQLIERVKANDPSLDQMSPKAAECQWCGKRTTVYPCKYPNGVGRLYLCLECEKRRLAGEQPETEKEKKKGRTALLGRSLKRKK